MLKTARRKKAAALGYNAKQDKAPRVLAAGGGSVADRILELAKAHDIPVHHDPDLANLLSSLQVGQHIPPELYKLVAEILIFLYEIDEDYGMKRKT